jgi:hypothetical protein
LDSRQQTVENFWLDLIGMEYFSRTGFLNTSSKIAIHVQILYAKKAL